MKNLPVKHDDAQDGVMARQLTDQYHKAIGGLRDVLIFGAMMIRLREINSTRGIENINDLRKHKGGGLKGWLMKNCPEISIPTAWRFMGLADGIREMFQLAEKTDLELLLSAPDGDLKPAWLKQRAKIMEFIEGKSQRQLAFSFMHDRGDIGGNPMLYKWLKEFHPELVGDYTKPKDMPPELRAEFMEWADAHAAPHPPREKMNASDTWKRLCAELAEEGLLNKTWGHLPHEEMDRVYNMLNDIRKEIGAALRK